MKTQDPGIERLLTTRPLMQMHSADGLLFEAVPLKSIAQEVGTPCWVTSAGTLRHRARALKDAFAAHDIDIMMHYALKANDHLASLTLLQQEGCGADVVSGGEILRALQAGIDPERSSREAK